MNDKKQNDQVCMSECTFRKRKKILHVNIKVQEVNRAAIESVKKTLENDSLNILNNVSQS